MERRRTLDSSMSSIYSGSNASNTLNRQHDNFNYPTTSGGLTTTTSNLQAAQSTIARMSVSPTPSGPLASSSFVGGINVASSSITSDNISGIDFSAADVAGASGSGSAAANQMPPGLRATTIGTVVVRCGPIQLVIALLQSPEKIYIKVVELEPKITTLGTNVDESLHMQRDHDETLRNIQQLPGPMDEFVQKADKLLASKRISSELVNAMADTLNIIWQDIVHLMEDRQHILNLCTQFHEKMIQCQYRMDQLESACIDTMLPIEVSAVQEFLGKFKQLRIDMLTAVMAALKDGNELLAQLQDLVKMETLDTRPDHIKRDAMRSIYQVQQWLEALHDRRNALEIAWQTRKTQLEQCLALALLGRELDDLELALRQQQNEIANMFSLGECEHTANNALHNYRDLKQHALLLRDRALKITRAKEKLQASGHFSGDEANTRAYNILSVCTDHLDVVDQREHLLQISREFFAKAENTLSVLEKLEVELSNVKLPQNSPESFAMYSKIERDVRNFTEEPLRLGYSILDEVGRTKPETQGIKRVLDEIENRKVYIESICNTSNEDHQRVQKALSEFLVQYNDLLSWLMSSGQMYLQQHVEMGRNLHESKQFLLQHHELMQDLEIKGELINLLLESIKSHLESLSPQQRYDVDSKAENLHKHWIELKDLVLKRVDGVSLLIQFFEKANELNNQLDNVDRQLRQTPNEQKLQFLQETWTNIRADFSELKNVGFRFINTKVADPYLETKSSTAAVEDILNSFSKRQVDVSTSIENWTTQIAEKREIEIILERIMTENEDTAAKTSKVDIQLYPVFTSPSVDASYLHTATKEKLTLVLKDIEKAQDEIQQRIQTTNNIQTRDQESLQKIEQVINNLRALKSKLDGIKYDYKALLENILQFLENIINLRRTIDEYFAKHQAQQFQQLQQSGGVAAADAGIQRIIAEHEKFRDTCMDKFRSSIAQSELLIDRVRVLEPQGAREIDTDRILKLLENLRIYFETGNNERMSNLERLEKLEQFKSDLCDINRSLDSVSKQLHEINGQNVDSLAAAKTTSLAFEYFERTIELLEKRIEKFTESTIQQLQISNPEHEAYARDELRKLNDKWHQFKDQVKYKRNALNQANDFFEMVEKIDAEYREICYFYNSVSNKITYLRDPVEAVNLVNDIEKYISNREGPLREKLDNAAKSTHDMNKISSLYNDVMTIFQSFTKLKSDINVVQERLKNEERQREQREKVAREAAELEARERAMREEEARLLAIKEKSARDQAERDRASRELAERERAIREEEARLQAAREAAAREHAEREQAAREKAMRAEEARLIAIREQAAREEAERERVARELAERERAIREEEVRLQVVREQALREHAAREQAAREEEARIRALHEEEKRLQALREQAKREEEQRMSVLREIANREEDARLQALRDEVTQLKTVRDQTDHHRVITENIRKDIQINEVFSEMKYASPRFLRELKDAITREGDRIIFECEVSGNPEPAVEWFKDGISIQNNPDYKTTYDKGICRLTIEESFTADSARFSCHASNLVGATETNAILSVRENASEIQMAPPRILRFLESGKAIEGQTFQFYCVVSGNPLPTVSWYKNDKCIDDSPDYVINYNNGEATLRFEEVFLEDDAVYTCSATNPAGIEHCSASLIVEPLEPTEIPHFKIPLSNVMARVGQKIKLEALIGGIPRPEIYWTQNGKPLEPREIKYEYGRVTLIISQAYPNDAGLYILTAKNLAGESYCSCNVIVKGRLPNETSDSELASDMEPIKPSVQLPLKDISIFEGKPVRLDCVIVGQPEPEVIWYHNERPVKESADVQLLFQGDRCSLIIQEVYQEDAGNYKVVAINSAGEASSSCELKVTSLNISEPATRARSERISMPKEVQPKFEKFLSDVLADEGETVQMEVVASGDQPLSAKWYLTNKELTENERITTITNPGAGVFKLIIRNVNADDKGVYTIKVSNNAGDAKCFSQLIVKSINAPDNQRSQQIEIIDKFSCPEFREIFTDKSAYADDVVKFECIVKGKPTPKIHWYFNDQPVQGHNFLVSTSGERQVLTVQQVSPDTVGKISCIAENEAGKATCIAFLSVFGNGLESMPATSNLETTTQEHNTESSRVTIKKQTFTTTSTSQVNSYEGNMPQTEVHHSSAHIDQSLKQFGNQRPEILESHHYQELHKGKQMSSPQMQQKSFVLVQSASTGATTNAVALPSLLTRKQIAPRFTSPLTGKIVDQGADICMEAIYDGYPSPEIKVEKNGEALFDTERLKIVNKFNRISIDLRQVGVSDAGRYAVTAINPMGQSTSTADLVVKKTVFPPVFGRRLQAQVVKKGEKIIMEVEVTGLPEPTVTWMKDDKPLKETGISEHRMLAQGNSYKLIIEKGQISDSGKYMVKATNAGGEAKSIADCAILEPSPERMQEVVKTIVYETPSEYKTENIQKEPLSFQTNQSEVSNTSDLHGLSESKIITEHRCTTEATMRLEHKTPDLDLPTLSQRPKTPSTDENKIQLTNLQMPDLPQLKTSTTITSNTDTNYNISKISSIKPVPPPVPPKPCTPVTAILVTPTQPIATTMSTDQLTTSSTTNSTTTNEKKSSSFQFFKKIESQNVPTTENYKKYEIFRPITLNATKTDELRKSTQQTTLEEDLKNLNLVPGPPPEICYIPKIENITKTPMITQRIKLLEECQLTQKESPQGGIPLILPTAQPTPPPPALQSQLKTPPPPPPAPLSSTSTQPTQQPFKPTQFTQLTQPTSSSSPVSLQSSSHITFPMQTTKHETTFSKEVKVEYAQPITRPAAVLPTPGQQHNHHHSQSPKPSAEALAMEKLWTPTHVSGYETGTSDIEQNIKIETSYLSDFKREHEIKIQKLPTPTAELSAPTLVKLATKSIPIIKQKNPLDDIQLVPGSPPEICFAPKTEVRRRSLVETMEKTLEQNLLQGPSKVLPLSVPTLTPVQPTVTTLPRATKQQSYRPPPPVMPTKLGRSDFYESDYESDRIKYSGSESDEAMFRPTAGQRPKSMVDGITTSSTTQQTFKTSGYSADTEDISNYHKMESMKESRSYFESTTGNKLQQQQQPTLEKQPSTQMYFKSQNGHDKSEYSTKNEYKTEEKDYKCTSSMTSNISYNMPTSNTTGSHIQTTPIKAPRLPSPVTVQRKTPAEFSDYSSEIDERFRSVSRTYESDSDLKGYRVVFPPTPTPKSTLTNGHKSPVVVVTPSPMEFEVTPPTVGTFARQKFEPIQKEIRHEIITEKKQQKQFQQKETQQQQHVYKPKPVAAKFLAATQQQQYQQPKPQSHPQPQPQQQQQPKPTLYYNAIAGTPLHTAKMATEMKNVMHMKESSETCERVVNMQQTKRVIHFDKEESSSQSHMSTSNGKTLEPFPYSPSPVGRYTPIHHFPPPPTPTKFVPGEFCESEYANEIENAKITPLWTPYGDYGPLRFRHVEPPKPGRACSLPRAYERVLSPMEFDRGPEMPTKIQVDPNSLRKERSSSVTSQNKTQSLNRHSSMRSGYNQRFIPTPLYEQQAQQQQQQQQQQHNFPRDDMNLKVGSPPKYGYIQSQAEMQSKHIESTFLRKSNQFMEDESSDLRKTTKFMTNGDTSVSEPKVITHTFRPGFKRAPSEGDNRPQAYRDESRVSQYGTKCVDPNTGLIYFKYDFGYEFGILFPGEGKKFVGGQWNSASSSSLPKTNISTNTANLQSSIQQQQQHPQQSTTGRKSPYMTNLSGELSIPVKHEHTTRSTSTTTTKTTPSRAPTPTRYGVGSNTNLYTKNTQSGFHSDTETMTTARTKTTKRPNSAFGSNVGINRLRKRYSLPNTQNIDIFIDRLHDNDTLNRLPFMRNTVPELPNNTPVNAHLNRDEQLMKPPQFITPLKDIAVVAGQTARFECIVQSHPTPTVTWSKDAVPLEQSNRHVIEYRNGVCRLTLPQAFPVDAGVYNCNATNPMGTAMTTGKLAVTEREKILIKIL